MNRANLSSSIPAGWDLWLAAAGAQAGFCQTSHWARMREVATGAKPHVVEIVAGGERGIGGLFFHERPSGNTANRALRLLGDGTLDCVEGPVAGPECDAATFAQWLDAAETLGRSLGVSRVSVSPRVWAAPWLRDDGAQLIAAGWTMQPWQTALVDLTADETALFAGFDHAARKGVRKCEQGGLIAEECRTWDDYRNNFVAPFHASFGHEHALRRSEADERAIFDASVASGAYRYYVARLPGGPVHAMLGVYCFNGVATEVMSGRTAEGLASGLPAQDLLHWTALRRAREYGAQIFDLAGFNPEPESPKEAGIRRFKLKWGGRIVASPRFVRERANLATRALRTMQGIKSLTRASRAPVRTQSAG